MKGLITEGEEDLIDLEEEEKYIFKGSSKEMDDYIELIIELRKDPSARIFIVVYVKYLLSYIVILSNTYVSV